MNKVTVRSVLLAAAMMLCLLAQHPQRADAAACPATYCGTLLAKCAQRPCSLVSTTFLGNCTFEGQTSFREVVVRCTCTQGVCYE
jgi:hypothetical protein